MPVFSQGARATCRLTPRVAELAAGLPLAGTLQGGNRKFLDQTERNFGWQRAMSLGGPLGSGPASLVSFAQRHHPLHTRPSSPIPPSSSALPIAPSVFINLGRTGEGLEGHGASRTTHSQQSTEQRTGRTAPGASWLLAGVWWRQGRGAPVDMPRQLPPQCHILHPHDPNSPAQASPRLGGGRGD